MFNLPLVGRSKAMSIGIGWGSAFGNCKFQIRVERITPTRTLLFSARPPHNGEVENSHTNQPGNYP